MPETGSQFAGNRQNLFIETEITTEITAERETRAQSAPFDSVEETAPDYKPNLDDIEVALCQAVGWITDLLDPSQYSGIRTAAKSLRAQPTVISAPASLTVERIGRAREFYQSQKKFSFAPSWIARDWAGLLAWIEAGNAGAKSGAAGLEAARAAMLASEAERARRRGTR